MSKHYERDPFQEMYHPDITGNYYGTGAYGVRAGEPVVVEDTAPLYNEQGMQEASRLKELIARFQDRPEMVAALQRQLDNVLQAQYPTQPTKPQELDSEAQRDMANRGVYDYLNSAAEAGKAGLEGGAKLIAQPAAPAQPVSPAVPPVAPAFSVARNGDGSEYEVPYVETKAANPSPVPERVEDGPSINPFIGHGGAQEFGHTKQDETPFLQKNVGDALAPDANTATAIHGRFKAARENYPAKKREAFDWGKFLSYKPFG